MKTVVLVACDPEYRQKLAALSKTRLGFSSCLEAESLLEACHEGANPELLLIDLAVPDAAEELRWGGLRFCHPAARIVALCTEYDKPLKLAFIAGATGFIPKDLDDENLAARLKEVMQGIHVVADDRFFERVQMLQTEAQHGLPSPDSSNSVLDHLTPHQREILSLLSQGASNKEIAAQLILSERTVRNSVSEILSKLNLRNRTQVALWAWEQGLGRERKL